MTPLELTPVATQVVNDILCREHLETHICNILNAEEALEQAAAEDDSWKHDYYFRYAYELRKLRIKLEKIEEEQGYEKSR